MKGAKDRMNTIDDSTLSLALSVMARMRLAGSALCLLVGLSCLDADCEPGDPSCQLLALSYGMDDGGGNATIGVFVRSGGSWTRVDSYIPPGYLSANPRSIDAGFGALNVAAELNDAANLHTLLRRSSDGGATWQDLKFFNAQQVDVISSVRSGWAPGVLFAFGVRGTLAMNTPIVDISRDGGLSWTTIQTDTVAGSSSTGNGFSARADIGDVYYATSHNAGGERYIARRIRCY